MGQVSIDRGTFEYIWDLAQNSDFMCQGYITDEMRAHVTTALATREETDTCGECNQSVALTPDGRVPCHNFPMLDPRHPVMCPSSGTTFYISRNCVCERVIDQCRCGSGERDED